MNFSLITMRTGWYMHFFYAIEVWQEKKIGKQELFLKINSAQHTHYAEQNWR